MRALLFRCCLPSLAVLYFSSCGLRQAAAARDDAATGAAAKEPVNRRHWNAKTTSVAVFKNGLGFFMRAGEVELRDGWCLAGQVPPAAFGALAIYSLQDDEQVDIVGSGPGEVVEFDGVDAPDNDETRRNRLAACKHLKVQLTYKHHDQPRSAAGKLAAIGQEFAVLESETNSFAVPIAEITRLQVLELPLRIHVAGDDARPVEKTQLGMAYLRKGITWVPEYTLRILDDATAELSLRGTLVNEAEDLVHCDVKLVVGVPHFVHTDYLTPLAVGQVIRSIGAAVAPAQVQSQIMNRAAITANQLVAPQFNAGPRVVEQPAADAGGNLGDALGNLPQFETTGSTDYTVYTKQDLTLRRGEKAILTLLKKKIRYSELYRWSPPEAMQHFLVLHNETSSAWTTGPCLAVSGEQPLSEDLLHYTPKGGVAELPVTSAINVSHEKSEIEFERRLKAHSASHNVFLDLVTLEGTLKLKNFEQRPAEIIVSVNVPGKPVAASDEGAMTVDSTKLKLRERSGSVRWKIKLEPGETVKRTYRYERYVDSY